MPTPRAAPDEGPYACFPHPFRPHQRELLGALHAGLSAGRHVVVESGTGTGKTACALSAALGVARVQGLRVLYLTRTNSQAKQVMVEYRRIRARAGGCGAALALQGRQHLCPLRREDPELEGADAEELGVMCRDRMRAAEATHAGREPKLEACRYHLRGLQRGTGAIEAWAREAAPEAEELAARAAGSGLCPFVVSRSLLPDAELVVAPSIYFLHPHLRAMLLRLMGVAPQDLLVIVDEAHNLPQHARDLASPRLGMRTLDAALAETRRFGDPAILSDLPLSRILTAVRDVARALKAAHLADGMEDALLPPDELDVALLSALRASTPGLARAIVAMGEYAAAVREAKRAQGKRPRSDVGAVAAFLQSCRSLDATTHAHIVEADEDGGARLVLHALDASVLAGALDDARATAHLSGTLQPLEEYRESIGLPRERTDLATFPSPFDPARRLVLVDETVTTRHEDLARDPAMWARIGERLRELRAATDRNVAIFLPSYEALHRLAPYVRGERAFVETRGARQDELMAQVAAFKATRGGTLLSVVGGRLSEGLDFPDEELEVVIVVGLPYAKPSAKLDALVRFYDQKAGQGWAWAVRAPMVRRVVQAAGRLIRTPEDRGVVVLLDSRASQLRDLMADARATRDPAAELRAFFQNQRYTGVVRCDA